MNDLISYIPATAGAWLMGTALALQTQNIKSSMFFKVIPFFLGLGCLLATGKMQGWF